VCVCVCVYVCVCALTSSATICTALIRTDHDLDHSMARLRIFPTVEEGIVQHDVLTLTQHSGVQV